MKPCAYRSGRGYLSTLLIFSLEAYGCGSFSGAGEVAEGFRLLSGRLAPPEPGLLAPARQQVGLQVAALSIDTESSRPIQDVQLSRSFSPADNAGRPVAFRLALAIERSYVLVLQSPGGALGTGRLVSRITFLRNTSGLETDLIPAAEQPIELGELKFLGPESSSFGVLTVRLGESGSENPLAHNDVDRDGIPDLEDGDDDNDFVPDEGDTDAGGDGVTDAAQTFDALRIFDQDGNMIPDILEP